MDNPDKSRKCKLCNKIFSAKTSNSTLKHHLKNLHNIVEDCDNKNDDVRD